MSNTKSVNLTATSQIYSWVSKRPGPQPLPSESSVISLNTYRNPTHWTQDQLKTTKWTHYQLKTTNYTQYQLKTTNYTVSTTNYKLQTEHFTLQPSPPGTFARVCLCRHKTTSNFFALKILSLHDVIRLKQVDHVKNEKNILKVR